MADGQQQPFVDPQRLTGDEAGLYELVATFEYQGRPMTVEAISAAAGLDRETATGMLDRLTEQNVLERADAGSERAYGLARRDWSAAPGLKRHFPPGHGAVSQEPAGEMPLAAGRQPAQQAEAGTGRAYRQELTAGQVRAEHLRAEEDRGEQARAELERTGETGERHRAGADDRGQPRRPEPAPGTTAPEHLMAGQGPQGTVPKSPGTMIAQADSEEERPTRASFVSNTVPGKPDGEVDTRS